MAAGSYNITIEQGATFSLVVTWEDSAGSAVDLTGRTARMQIRDRVAATDTLIELTTENGRIALGGAAGTITLTITAADTAALDFRSGVYDLEIVNGAVVDRILEGEVELNKEVTR